MNTIGSLLSARIGMYYLRKNRGCRGERDDVLVSSMRGYMASKHGVVGIMRGLDLTATAENVWVNVICPWMTRKSESVWDWIP